MMNLRKKSETSTTITLEWDAVPGAIGYRFQSSATAPKWSHTFDTSRREVKFAKATSYKVEALGVEDSGAYPSTTPPSGEWTQVAAEYGNFTLASSKEVRYGLGSAWNTKVLAAGTYLCGNSLFGDPAPGASKVCQARTPGVPAGSAMSAPTGSVT